MSAAFLLTLLSAFSLDGGTDPVFVSDGGAEDAGMADGEMPASDAGGKDGALALVDAVQAQEAPPPLLVSVVGKVLVRGTRQPLVGALVHLGIGNGTSAVAETGADGSFAAEVLPGLHRMRVQAPGYAPLLLEITVPTTHPLVVRLEPRTDGERYETVVVAERDEEPSVPLQKEELVHTAGSLGDPFRVVESLPGVAQTTWPLPFYAIRGANPGNTGFFLDGVRVPALFHFALGPSVIHPFFIDELAFYPGGYPVAYGRYVSGIVAAQTATPATDRLHVSADVRLFDAGGIVATPWDHGKGTLAVAGRYSYTGLLLSAFSNAYALNYWDYQVRIEHTLGPGSLTLFAFGSGDNLSQKNPDVTDYGFSDQPALAKAIAPGLARLSFHRAQLRWDGRLAGGRFTLATVAGIDDSTVSLTSVFSLPIGSHMVSLAPRISERWSPFGWLDVEVGADAEIQKIRPTSLVALAGGFLASNYVTDLFRDRDVLSAGAYTGLSLRAGDRLILSPGLRYDGYYEQGTHQWSPSPRFLARLRVGAHDWVKATVGEFSQMPSLPLGVPGFESFGLADYGLQRSRQASIGLESGLADRLGVDLNLDTSLFYQRLHLTDLRNTLLPAPEARDLLEPREGESYGLEVMVRRPMKHKLYGWLAYTLSRSLRVVDGIIVPSDWDQTHILNLVVGYRWPRNYATSARFHYNSGRPYPLLDAKTNDMKGYTHLPGFPQLDLRVDKRYVFDNFTLEAYLEVVNATFSTEVYDIRRETTGNITQSGYRFALPSAGVHVDW